MPSAPPIQAALDLLKACCFDFLSDLLSECSLLSSSADVIKLDNREEWKVAAGGVKSDMRRLLVEAVLHVAKAAMVEGEGQQNCPWS